MAQYLDNVLKNYNMNHALGIIICVSSERQLDSLVRQVECCSVQRALSFLCAAQSPLAYIFTDAVTLLKVSIMIRRRPFHV